MKRLPLETRWRHARKALQALCSTIEATGGCVDPGGICTLGLKADREWLDLAEAYVLACGVLGRKPMITREKDEDLQ